MLRALLTLGVKMGDPNFNNPVTPAAASNFFSKMLNFDTMIGPTLIRIMYFVGLVVFALMGVGILLSGVMMMTYNAAVGLLYIILSPVIIILYAIFWRFACELWILTFKIYDRLGEIKNKLP